MARDTDICQWWFNSGAGNRVPVALASRKTLVARIRRESNPRPPSGRGPFSGTMTAAHSRRTRRNTEGTSMEQHLVFAISREYGSGGREIGERLASELGIAYYDKLLLKRIAEESGLSGDVVEDFDEKPMRPLLLNPNSFFCGTDIEHPVASRIYKTEVDILKSIADEGPCVIVGRCADYVLNGHPGLVSLFVSAPMEARIARVMRRNDLSEADARSRIARVDKNRANYYRYFTDENWGQARNYDLCINSGDLDALGAVSVIKAFVEARGK